MPESRSETDYTREADRYDRLGRSEAAQRLRRQASVIASYEK